MPPIARARNSPLTRGTRRFRCLSTGTRTPTNGIVRNLRSPFADRRLLQVQQTIHRRLHSHSWRLLRASQAAREAARVTPVHYRSGRGLGARPPSPTVAALSEIETAFRAGFRSIRAFKWARRHGGFPEPARVTPQGPIWTERQIAHWLGEADPLDRLDVVMAAPTGDDEVSEDEATLLREIEQRGAARRRMREVA
jgi:hypothetical protein